MASVQTAVLTKCCFCRNPYDESELQHASRCLSWPRNSAGTAFYVDLKCRLCDIGYLTTIRPNEGQTLEAAVNKRKYQYVCGPCRRLYPQFKVEPVHHVV